VEPYEGIPDAKAAEAVVEAIDELLPQIKLDVSPPSIARQSESRVD